MGFFEDDRIRIKNKKYNEATEIYEGLKALGYSDQEVERYAKFAIGFSDDPYRNDVLHAIISMVATEDNCDSEANN